MICAVTTFVSSMQNYVLRSAIYNYGDWHGSEVNTGYTVYEEVPASGQVDDAVYLQQIGYAMAEGCQNEYKPYLYVLGGSDGVEEMLSVHITAGNFPVSTDEILLPNHLASNGGMKHKLGDIITLELGDRMLDGSAMLTSLAAIVIALSCRGYSYRCCGRYCRYRCDTDIHWQQIYCAWHAHFHGTVCVGIICRDRRYGCPGNGVDLCLDTF